MQMSAALRGWDVGTLEILKISVEGLREEMNGLVEMAVMSSGTTPKVNTEATVSEPVLKGDKWTFDAWAMHWVFKPRLRIPVVYD